MCGRWRNGVPLALSPESDSPVGGISPEQLNDFEYVNTDGSGDPKGLRCPVGAHMRRINPRGQPVTGQGQPGGSNNTHRLIRRGLPYGPVYDPTRPYDGIARGLLGYFINSSIENQYEFVLSQWVNDSEFAGAVRLPPKSKDPMIGTQNPAESIFVVPQANGASPDQNNWVLELRDDESRRLLLSAQHHRAQIYRQAGLSRRKGSAMLFLTRWFGVTGTDAERDLAREQFDIEQIVEKSLLLQPKAAAGQKRPLGRGMHVKGVCARAQFEVLDVAADRDPGLARRLAQGMFARPGVCPAIVRFANADPNKNSDFKADVRSLSFAVELTDAAAADGRVLRQDFSMQNATTLPINDSPAFLATMKLLTGVEPDCRPMVVVVQGQVESVENAGIGANASASNNQAVSAAALLEHCAVSSRTGRGRKIFGYAVAGQSVSSLAKEQSERPAR